MEPSELTMTTKAMQRMIEQHSMKEREINVQQMSRMLAPVLDAQQVVQSQIATALTGQQEMMERFQQSNADTMSRMQQQQSRALAEVHNALTAQLSATQNVVANGLKPIQN